MSIFESSFLCTATLESAIFAPTWQALIGVVVSLISILGWGLCCELLPSRNKTEYSLCHAFLQGIALLPIVRSLTSILGYCNSSWAIAILGCIGFAISILLLLRGPLAVQERRFTDLSLAMRLTFAVIGLLVFAKLLAFPSVDFDTNAIGGYHAKALTCECLYSADYTNEMAWASSHPNYPPQLAYLHSYLYTLMGSFRDDWSKVWMALASVSAIWITLLTFVQRKPRPRYAYLIVLALASFFLHPTVEGKSEFGVVLFAILSLMAIVGNTPERLPLYLLGLAFSKNEGLVGAAILLVLFAISRFRKPYREVLPALILSVFAILLATLIIFKLPSRHEQYAARLLDISVWKQGLSYLPVILNGWLTYFFKLEPWTYFIIPILLFLPSNWMRNKDLRIAWLWVLSMILMFNVVYIISPWGAHLYKTTIERIMFPYFMVLLLAHLWAIVPKDGDGKWRKRLEGIAHGYFLIVLLIVFGGEIHRNWTKAANMVERHQLGIGYYRNNAHWAHALRIDKSLPPGATAALIHADCYEIFKYNYMLYPRKLYAAPRNQALCTWRPWKVFDNQQKAQDAGFEHFIDVKAQEQHSP